MKFAHVLLVAAVFAVVAVEGKLLPCDTEEGPSECQKNFSECRVNWPPASDSSTDMTNLCIECIPEYGLCLNKTGCFGILWDGYVEICNGRPNCDNCLAPAPRAAAAFAAVLLTAFAAALFA